MRLQPPEHRMTCLRCRVVNEFFRIVLDLMKLDLWILRIKCRLDVLLMHFPKPDIEMHFPANRNQLERIPRLHLTKPDSLYKSSRTHEGPQLAYRGFHRARRFADLARNFHFKQDGFCIKNIEGSRVPNPNMVIADYHSDREPYRLSADYPSECKKYYMRDLEREN